MSKEDPVVVVSGARTPFARARTAYANMTPAALGGAAIREAVARSNIDPNLIDELYFGIVTAPAEGSNIGREGLFDSGLPSTIPCTTVNRYCASAAEAAGAVMNKIEAGQMDIGVAGGVESISSIRALFSLKATNYFQDFMKKRTLGQKLSHLSKFKAAYLAPMAPGIKEPTIGISMGQSADLMARIFNVTREAQDEFAVKSHQKAAQAWEKGFYQTHVFPTATPDGKVIEKDTDIRADTTVEKIKNLRPVFYKDGTISAANASPLTDGASALLLARKSKAKELQLPILGKIRGYAVAGVDIKKEPLLIGPVYAFERAMKNAQVDWKDIDLFEIHEAFAAQVLATLEALRSKKFAQEKLNRSEPIGEVNPEILNVNGGSIPLGHPFGATGGRLILQALHELRARKKNLCLISICAAGGLGLVMIVEADG